MKSNPAAFLLSFAAVGLVTCLGIAAVNVIVDPFQIFDLVSIDGFNAQRLKAASEARMMKAIQVCLDKPTAVVMGTSRVEVGMNPSHPGWKDGARPYNLALAGTGLAEIDMTFRHVVHASAGLKQVAIGLDFLMFNANREAHVFGTEVLGFEPKRLLLKQGDSCFRSVLFDAFKVLGVSALKYSMATIRSQMPAPVADAENFDSKMVSQWIAQYDPRGYRGVYYEAFKALLSKGGSRRSFDSDDGRPVQETYYVDKIWRPSPEKRYCFARANVNTLEGFKSMIDFAYESGVDVRFFINPIHARMLIAIHEAGLWPTYEAWKRDLAKVVEEEGQKLGHAPIPLWDFSGFNTVTTESIPPMGVKTPQMRYWWEPSHYQSLVGAMILDRVLDYRDPMTNVPPDFGIRLDSATINGWIAKTRGDIRNYTAAEPQDAKIVSEAIDHLREGEEGADCGEDVQALYDGLKLKAAGDVQGAEVDFQRGVAIHEAERKLYAEMDAPFREAGFDPLLAKIRAGEQISPRLGTAAEYQDRAASRMAAADYDGAIEDLNQAYKITPYNDVLKYLLGAAHEKRGETRLGKDDLAGADADLTNAMDFWSTNPQASLFFLRGSARQRLGRTDDALKDFSAGLALDPDNKTLAQLRDEAQSDLLAKQK